VLHLQSDRVIGHTVHAAIKAGHQAARYTHRGRRPSMGPHNGTQEKDMTVPPLGFGSSDDCGEGEESAGNVRKR
jgi:hypothetical protein